MTEKEIMSDFDPSNYDDRYCNKIDCHECDGADFNSEPNGYGCQANDNYIDTRYQSILKRRRKNATNTW